MENLRGRYVCNMQIINELHNCLEIFLWNGDINSMERV
jgi:hypothetical protein